MKTKTQRELGQSGRALGEQRGQRWKNSSGVISLGARKWPGIGVKDERGLFAAGQEELAALVWWHILYILQPHSTQGSLAALSRAARHAAQLAFHYPLTHQVCFCPFFLTPPHSAFN